MKPSAERSYLDRETKQNSSVSGAHQAQSDDKKIDMMADIQSKLRNKVNKEFKNLNSVEQESLMKSDVFLNANQERIKKYQ